MSSITITSDITETPAGVIKLAVQTSSEDMPAAVFVIEVLPKSRDPKNTNYRLSHVASLTELIELPAEEDPNQCYFRTDDIACLFDTTDIAVETLKIMRSDIDKLVLQYNQLNDPSISGTTVTISGTTESGL